MISDEKDLEINFFFLQNLIEHSRQIDGVSEDTNFHTYTAQKMVKAHRNVHMQYLKFLYSKEESSLIHILISSNLAFNIV